MFPYQPPEAVHESALVELQFNVEYCPFVIELGLAEIEQVGTGLAVTVTGAEQVTDPPAPVQFNVYVEFEVGETDCVPDNDFVPDQALDAVQESALLELQLKVEDCPLVIELGFAEIEQVGT